MWEKIESLKQQVNSKYNINRIHSNRVSNIKLILFIVTVFFFILGESLGQLKQFCFIVAAATGCCFIWMIVIHSRLIEKCEIEERQLNIIKQYEARRNGDWKQFKENGSCFINEENKSLMDLNILGEYSIFQWLNVSITGSGKRKLFERLVMTKYEENSWKKCQKSVEEMAKHSSFGIMFQAILSGIRGIKELDFEDEKLYPKNCKKAEYLSLFFSSILALIMDGSIILSLCEIVSFRIPAVMLFFSIGFLCVFSFFHKKEYEQMGECIHAFGKMERVVNYVLNEEFKGEMLCECQRKIQQGAKTLHYIKRLAALYYAKQNMFSNVLFNTLFFLNPLLIFVYRNTMKEGSEVLYDTMNCIEKIELYIALAGVAWCKDCVCMPHKTKELCIYAKEIKHPLLLEKQCVANDFCCGEEVVIITGSNMSGKSSFMRTIGINLVLMYAGTYVTAERFEAPFMKIFTSIGVQDDISRGISTFYGELLRIKKVLDYANNNENKDIPFVVFIDEIFKGTNYNDRLFGAKAVVHKLAEQKCITFITTHDFELCDMSEKKVSNYNFTEKYDGDQIIFDHKIRLGRCNTTNARYLMERIGVLSTSN